MSGKIEALLIAGPTASGKSALALEIARARGGVVINADSMQVYRDLRVITARPTPEDEAQAPHRLYGHVDAGVNYSVGHYLRDAAAVLDEARAAGQLSIFVGGTGLYFKALLEGLSQIPPVPGAVREKVRASGEGRTGEELHADLARRDPATAARLRTSDRLRILRALEVLEATGEPLVSFQGRKSPGPLAETTTVRVFMAPDRDWLRRRIDRRFEGMIETGALAEVRALAARRLDPMLPAMRAHGVPGLLAHLRGEISSDAAIARGQADTRRYAKRQFTWFRHQMQMPGWHWIAPEEGMAAVLAALGQSGRDGAS
jgi:tRNA dimethylallyltransferase